MPNDTIIAPRVPLVDPRTGQVAREWYLFFYALANLVLVNNNTSISDLMVGPSSGDTEIQAVTQKASQALQVAPTTGAVEARVADLVKRIQALQVAPAPADTTALAKAVQGLQETPPIPDTSALSRAIQALAVAPPVLPYAGPGVTTVVATLNFPNTAAGACSDLTVTLPGVVDGDVVTLGVPSASVPANGVFFAWVSAADTVTVRYANNDLVTAYNPASGDFRIAASRF